MRTQRATLLILTTLLLGRGADAVDWTTADLWVWPDSPAGAVPNEGKWSSPVDIFDDNAPPLTTRINPVHAALLPYTTGSGLEVGKIVAYRGSTWKIYDLSSSVETTKDFFAISNGHRPFCNGANFTADGKLVIVGGSLWEEDGTSPATGCTPNEQGWISVFDPQTDMLSALPSIEDLLGIPSLIVPETTNNARYYASLTTLPDGKLLLTSGNAWRENRPVLPEDPGCFDEGFPELTPLQTQWLIYDPANGGDWLELDESGSMLDSNLWSSGWKFPGRERWPASTAIDYYPHMKVLPGGLFWEGWDSTTSVSQLWAWPRYANGPPLNTQHINGVRNEASCAILTLEPGQPQVVMIVGGGAPPSGGNPSTINHTAEWIAYKDDGFGGIETTTGTWVNTNGIAAPQGESAKGRRRPDLVMLPTGDLLLLGGEHYNGSALEANKQCAILQADTLDPENSGVMPGDWVAVDKLNMARRYHSAALLLPDGRVFVTGNENDVVDPLAGSTYEVFYPPYLFASSEFAKRPTITSPTKDLHYGLNATVHVGHESGGVADAADEIDEVCLVKLSTSTHATNMSQRRVKLSVVKYDASTLVIQAPVDSTWAPPGDYMLFVIDNSGVPSVADFVNVNGDGFYSVQDDETAVWGGACRLSRDFKVESGGTLEILPGTVVTVEEQEDVSWNQGTYPGQVEILVAGQLLAHGTDSKRITFTSGADAPAASDWQGIEFQDAADEDVSDLEYCDFEYPHHAVKLDSLSGTLFQCSFTSSQIADVYVPADTRVLPGKEWSLTAGTRVVAEAGQGVDIQVDGIIRTTGTEADPVVFTSTVPHAFTGDAWSGLTLRGNGWDDGGEVAIIDHTHFEYAVCPLYVIWADTVEVRNSYFFAYAEDAIRDLASDALIEGCYIERGPDLVGGVGDNGIHIMDSFTTAKNDTILAQERSGVWIDGNSIYCEGPPAWPFVPGTVTLDGLTIVGAGAPPSGANNSKGVFVDWACHEMQTEIKSCNIQRWGRGPGVRIFESSDVMLECNCIADNDVGVRHKRGDLEVDSNNRENTLYRNNLDQNHTYGVDSKKGPGNNAAGFWYGNNDPEAVVNSGENRMRLSAIAGSINYRLYGAAQARRDSAHASRWYDDADASYSNATALQADNSWRLNQVIEVDNWDVPDNPDCSTNATDCALGFLSGSGALPQGPASVPTHDGERGADATSSPPDASLPTRFGLAVIGGNPTRALVRTRLDVPIMSEGHWEVSVFDVQGRRVRNLVTGHLGAGRHQMVWDLRTGAGKQATPGVYFLRAVGPAEAATRKVVVVR